MKVSKVSNCLLLAFLIQFTASAQILKVAVAGLTHDHAHGIMNQLKRGEVIIIGIAESNKQLVEKYKTNYHLHDSLFYNDLSSLLAHKKPDVVLAYNAISEHLGVIEICAPKGISVMVEKPLCITSKEAERIVTLANQYKIHVLTNYETTWYATNQQINTMVNDQHEIGDVRKMIVHDGHQGPKEIGCSPEFLAWLTDPDKNGGGAIVDFGCYGANLMTWLMKGKQPVSITAITRHIKPDVYPRVDDEATILVEYEQATGIIEASWNWPFGIKDLEVFGQSGYLHALNGSLLEQRKKDTYERVSVKLPAYLDNLKYLADVLNGSIKPDNDLSSLNNNVIVVRILEAAKESAKSGRKIIY